MVRYMKKKAKTKKKQEYEDAYENFKKGLKISATESSKVIENTVAHRNMYTPGTFAHICSPFLTMLIICTKP